MSYQKYFEMVLKELNQRINLGIQQAQNTLKGKELFDQKTGLPTYIDNFYYATVTLPIQQSGYDVHKVNSFDTCVAFLIASFDGFNYFIKHNKIGIETELEFALEEYLFRQSLIHLIEKYDTLREDKELKQKFKKTFKHFCQALGYIKLTNRKDCDSDICAKLLKGKAIIDSVKSCRKTGAIN